jgi:serpin B
MAKIVNLYQMTHLTKFPTKMRTIILLTLSVSLLFSCSRKTQQGMHARSPQEQSGIMEKTLPERSAYFAFDLMRALPSDDKNLVFSPFSISTALAMTYAGAREQTMEEMAATLYFDRDQEAFHAGYGVFLQDIRSMGGEDVQISLANRLWAQSGYHFLPAFFQQLDTHYGSGVEQVDFRGDREPIRLGINQWVMDQTRDKIPDLIAPGVLTEDTRLVLVNAVYFLAKWAAVFDKDNTYAGSFRKADGGESTADYMQRRGRYPYVEGDGFRAVEMAYADGNFSMVVVLPDAGQSLDQFLGDFDAGDFREAGRQMRHTLLDLHIPKFKIESGMDLEKVLSAMGMPRAFSNRAEFSGMTGDDTLKIDKVIHKAMIEVQEAGTEAAAATAVVMIQKTSIDLDEPVLFKADRPFLFFIRDNRHHSILFMGQVRTL